MTDGLFYHAGYQIPIGLMELTGGGPDSFEAISNLHIAHLEKHVGLSPDHTIVEIGCGIGRDAIPLTSILGKSGRYIGLDVTKPSIDWCSNNISKRHSNFAFHHMNINDPIYNPSGCASILDAVFPVKEGTADLVIAQSVFTHMLDEGVFHYLCECRRVLKPSGMAYVTFFLLCEEVQTVIQHRPATAFGLSFLHERSAGCFVNNEQVSTAATAYTLPKIEQIIFAAGLESRRPLLRGSWSTMFPDADCGQDTLILGRR